MESNLSHIEVDHATNPFELFNEWYNEAKDLCQTNPDVISMATASLDGRVSLRSLLLRRVVEDGFVFITDSYSRKCKHLSENPNSAITVTWIYKASGLLVIRQIRCEGKITPLSPTEVLEFYEKEPVFSKIRSYLSQEHKVDSWDKHKERHDNLLKEVKSGKPLPKPDNVVGYKLIPDRMEFYHACGNDVIADRVVYEKLRDKWEFYRLAA